MRYKKGFQPVECGGSVEREHCDYSALVYENRRRVYLQFATRLAELLGTGWRVRLERAAEEGLLATHSPMFLAVRVDENRRSVVPLTVNTRGNKLGVFLPGVERKPTRDMVELAVRIAGLARSGAAPALGDYIEAQKERRLDINMRRGMRHAAIRGGQ